MPSSAAERKWFPGSRAGSSQPRRPRRKPEQNPPDRLQRALPAEHRVSPAAARDLPRPVAQDSRLAADRRMFVFSSGERASVAAGSVGQVQAPGAVGAQGLLAHVDEVAEVEPLGQAAEVIPGVGALVCRPELIQGANPHPVRADRSWSARGPRSGPRSWRGSSRGGFLEAASGVTWYILVPPGCVFPHSSAVAAGLPWPIAHPAEPPHSDANIVLTAVAVVGCLRGSTKFHNDVVQLREAGHEIDVVFESRGVFERRVTVTAEIGLLNLLLGEDPRR